MTSKIIDCFLFHNEKELLLARIEYLKRYVDFFCIVESEYTFTGHKKKFHARQIIRQHYGLKFLNDRVQILENCDYLTENNFQTISEKYANSPLHTELMMHDKAIKIDKFVWLNDCFQRELLSVAIRDCIKHKKLSPEVLTVIISDVDEIPSCSYVEKNLEENSSVVYAEMTQFRYNTAIIDDEKFIGSVKFWYDQIDRFSINELRFAVKRQASNIKDYHIQPNAGWHFTSFGTVDDIRHKMISWSHQELNTAVNRFFLPFRLKYGLDIFGRNISYLILTDKILPVEIQKQLRVFDVPSVATPNAYHKFLHQSIRVLDRLIYKIKK